MISIDKILVPTDFSENAAHAYPYARSMAEAFGASIIVVHVSDVAIYPVGPGQIPIAWERIASEVKDFNDAQMKKVREAFGDVAVEAVELEGSPFVELVQYARNAKVDLIVMSTHGHTGIKHLLMGSTAEKVVRKAPCPVLTMHPGDRDFAMP